MAFSQGRDSFSESEILERFPETGLAAMYLNVTHIPCTISNPTRKDRTPSLGLYAGNDGRVRFRDFATEEHGSILDLLCLMWQTDLKGLHKRLTNELTDSSIIRTARVTSFYTELKDKANPRASTLQCRIRRWLKRDIDYWESYGVPLNWLRWAEVYPITHTIITIGESRYVFGTDPLAYVFVEHKEGETTLKVYQPNNKAGRKWLNKHDRSVLGLWTKVPPTGERICICSSIKDALCLSANTDIPAICVQGEGYGMSKTACESLRSRYKEIYVLFDNDEAGLLNGKRLADSTGFTNIVLPQVEGAKDLSDIYHLWQDRERFRSFVLPLFNFNEHEHENDEIIEPQ